MLSKNQLGHELRRSLRLDVLQDVNLFCKVLHSLLISLVPKVPFLPPQALLLNTTAEATAQDPGAIVLREAIPEFTAFNNGSLKCLMRLFAIVDGGLVLIALRRGGIDTTDKRIVKFEIFIRRDHHGQERENDAHETTNQTQDQIKRVYRPSYLDLLSSLDYLSDEERIVVIEVVEIGSLADIYTVGIELIGQAKHSDLRCVKPSEIVVFNWLLHNEESVENLGL